MIPTAPRQDPPRPGWHAPKRSWCASPPGMGTCRHLPPHLQHQHLGLGQVQFRRHRQELHEAVESSIRTKDWLERSVDNFAASDPQPVRGELQKGPEFLTF